MRVSVVIPAYNEEAALPLLRERLSRVIDALREYEFAVLIVDDHSADVTPQLVEAWACADPRVRGLRLARNCGSHAALAAGLAQCTGDCSVLMAADLQDPPELLGELLARWRSGQDIVWLSANDVVARVGGHASSRGCTGRCCAESRSTKRRSRGRTSSCSTAK